MFCTEIFIIYCNSVLLLLLKVLFMYLLFDLSVFCLVKRCFNDTEPEFWPSGGASAHRSEGLKMFAGSRLNRAAVSGRVTAPHVPRVLMGNVVFVFRTLSDPSRMSVLPMPR